MLDARPVHYEDRVWFDTGHRIVVKTGPASTDTTFMTREQLEAHMTLAGWRPLNWGIGGALKGDLIVYAFHAQPYGDHKVATETGRLDDARKRFMGMWFMSNDIFFDLARKVMEIEACQHETIGTGGIAMRCSGCNQFVTR